MSRAFAFQCSFIGVALFYFCNFIEQKKRSLCAKMKLTFMPA